MSTARRILQFFFLGFLGITFAEREHKVHNIVLYPEKHSWCQITPIQQVVASPGYDPVTIDNNVCVGACYSYSIPKTQPAEPGELIGPYCDSCQPSEMKCYHVNLHADDKNLDGPKIMQKRVQILTNCSCQTCDKVRKEDCEITDENTLELPHNLFTDENSVSRFNFDDPPPDLLNAPSQNNTLHLVHNTEGDIKLKIKLKKWFEIYQNETDDSKNEEDLHSKYQKHKTHLEKYNSVELDPTQDNNNKIEKDLDNLSDEFEMEEAPSHHRGRHIGMGIQVDHNDIVVNDIAKKYHEMKSAGSGSHHNHHQHHGEVHHLHHLGEEQHIGMNVVHLIKGPHGSMVASPVEAKLHIDSDALKPNNEGVIIDYENHHKNHHKVSDILEED